MELYDKAKARLVSSGYLCAVPYVTDGWSNGASHVYSDNGTAAPYDLGDKVPFPLLSDPWRDPNTGAVSLRANGTAYTQEEYFTEVLLGNPNNLTDGIYNGSITLDCKNGSAFYWNASTSTQLTGVAAIAALPAAGDDYIKFNPATATLLMNGQIKINGSLSFSGGGSKDTLNYSGRCAFLTTGDVNIDVCLVTCNGGIPVNIANSFPANNCLGIMSKADINLGGGSGASQLKIMGGFYAAGTISSAKQTTVMGTFVSTLFNITKNVPNIFQVPSLADNLPYGMVGGCPISCVSQVSWREMGLS